MKPSKEMLEALEDLIEGHPARLNKGLRDAFLLWLIHDKEAPGGLFFKHLVDDLFELFRFLDTVEREQAREKPEKKTD